MPANSINADGAITVVPASLSNSIETTANTMPADINTMAVFSRN